MLLFMPECRLLPKVKYPCLKINVKLSVTYQVRTLSTLTLCIWYEFYRFAHQLERNRRYAEQAF